MSWATERAVGKESEEVEETAGGDAMIAYSEYARPSKYSIVAPSKLAEVEEVEEVGDEAEAEVGDEVEVEEVGDEVEVEEVEEVGDEDEDEDEDEALLPPLDPFWACST